MFAGEVAFWPASLEEKCFLPGRQRRLTAYLPCYDAGSEALLLQTLRCEGSHINYLYAGRSV